MPIITGIGRKNAWFFLFSALILRGGIACHSTKTEESATDDIKPHAQVSVVSVSTGGMSDQVPLSAVTAYLQRNNVAAPIPCFLSKVKVKLGQMVQKGDVLYELESKERKALGNAFPEDSLLTQLGKITIKAPISGIITVLDRQQIGDYVAEGSPLCTITENQSVVFILNVPYEFNRLTRVGETYSVILPDKRQINAKLTLPLSTVNAQAQTQQFWLKPETSIFLPEGLIATVMLTVKQKGNAQIVPKDCVLSDELMKDFWVMKLIDDSTAVKVPVQLGMKNGQAIEITNPLFNAKDRLLSSGNFGLADTTLIQIIKE